MKRPSERWSRSSAANAVSNGERVNASAIPVPRRSETGRTAAAPSGTHGLLASWIENTPSSPSSSARRAAAAVSVALRDGANMTQ